MRITREIVRHTAELARLDLEVLSEAEVAELQSQLDAILAYFERLQELDTSKIEPTTHAVPIAIPFREDEPEEGPERDRLLANAPQQEEGFFAVPRVIAE